jgi:hypothetical protein
VKPDIGESAIAHILECCIFVADAGYQRLPGDRFDRRRVLLTDFEVIRAV